MRKLDLIDKKILVELDTDARESFSKLGKKLGIGKNNVQYRVKRLQEDGIIKKFVMQPSLSRIGLSLGKVYLQLSGHTKEEEKQLFSYLMKDKRISWVAKCEGRWDLMIGAYVKSLQQFNQIKKDLFDHFENFITSYDVVFLVEGHTSQRTYLVDKKPSSKRVEKFMGEGKLSLKKIEVDILRNISNNARFAYTDLAQDLGINVKTVHSRIKKLEKEGVIQGYVTFLDPKKIGYNFFKLCISLTNYQQKLDMFIKYCMEMPNVIHVIESIGPWELELEIETETIQDFYNLTHEIRNSYPDIIKKVESVMISDEVKLDFFPEWL